MAIRLKPVRMRCSIYLLIPKGVAELLDLMAAPPCTFEFQVDEKGSSLVYRFPRPVSPLTREPPDLASLVLAQY